MTRESRRTFESAFVALGAAALLGVVASGCGVGDVPADGAHLDTKVSMLPSDLSGESSGTGGGGSDTDPGPVDSSKLGSVKGRITFNGSPPSLSFQGFTIAAGDMGVCVPEKIGNETLVVGDGGGVQNVCIWVLKTPRVAKPEATEAAETQVFNNVDCRFVPHCLLVEAGETFNLTSADASAHNTHTFPGAVGNTELNTLVAKDQIIPLTYKKPEKQPVFVKCDLHAWMKAYHLVVPDKRYAAVTAADGTFELTDLPHGKHTLMIWHEAWGGKAKKATVTVDAESVDFEASYGEGDFEIAGLVERRIRELVASAGR